MEIKNKGERKEKKVMLLFQYYSCLLEGGDPTGGKFKHLRVVSLNISGRRRGDGRF